MDGSDWADIIMAANSVFVTDYATVTGKPIAQPRPTSVMGAITGTDLSRSSSAQGLSSSAVLIILVVVVGAVVILK